MEMVADEVCKVRGIEGVRVVDPIVFPFALGAHYQGAVCAVAEQVSAARLIWFEGKVGKKADVRCRWRMWLLGMLDGV
jgi:choline dehydrogenase-like flavoprotein